MMAYAKKRLYRSRNGKIFGVCQGIADWRDLRVEYIRIILIMAFIFTGFFPVGALYFLAALIIPMEPEGYNSRSDRSEWVGDKGRMYDNVREDFRDLKDRVRDMEERVFDKEKDWEDRFKRGR